ncbi:MAG: ABC transporter permease, partial [Pyrinomonadaceae bacterium]
MLTLWQDLRYGLRMLFKNPGVSLVVILTLALGIGATIAIFSVVNAVLLRPLPYRDSNQLVMVWGNFLKLNMERIPAKAAEYVDYAGQGQIFDAVAGFSSQSFNLSGGDRPERVRGTQVTSNLFSVLGAQPAQGRVFTTDENQAGRDNVIVLSYGFWQRRFAGDSRVVNQTVTLDDRSYTVIGVMPADFQFPHSSLPSSEPAEVWVPVTQTTEQIVQRRGPYFLNVLARLKSGITVVQAQTEMSALAQRFEQEQRGYRGPNGEDGGWRITVVPLLEEIVGGSRRALLMLFGAVGLVLLIACANVANLLLVRAAKRRKELAIRAALGASQWRVVRQLLVEGLLLTLLGGSVGLLLARWGVELLTALSPADLPRAHEINIDGRVLAFAALTPIVTGILFGLVPALQASKLNLQSGLKEKVAGPLGSWRQPWSNALVVAEVALSLLLLIGAGLLVNSFLRLQQVNPGIAADRLVTAEINLSASRYGEPAQASAFYSELARRVESLPGVQAASFSTLLPLSGAFRNDPFAIEGRSLELANPTTAGWQMVGANYLQTLGIPLVSGRDVLPQDMDPEAPVVAVINERMAVRYWPNENPVGRRVTLGLPRSDNPWVTIVGIAKDLPHRAKDSAPEPDWYLTRTHGPQLNRYLLVRTLGESASLANAIRSEASAIDRDQPVTSIRTMNEVIGGTIA